MRLLPAAAASALLVGLLTGCPSVPFQPSAGLEEQIARSVVRVVDRDDEQRGLAVVVRATSDRVALVMADPRVGVRQLFLAFGEERVLVRVRSTGGLLLLEAPRAERDLRAIREAKTPRIGEFVFLYAPLGGGQVGRGVTSVSRSSAERLHLLWVPPLTTEGDPEGDERSPSERLAQARGALVFAPSGAFVGFVGDRPEGEEPDVVSPGRLSAGLLRLLEALPGAELMHPGDVFRPHEIELRSTLSPDALPPVEDGWGEPDFFLLLEDEGRRLARLEITPGRSESGTMLVNLPSHKLLTARLVERDLTLTGGEEEEDLADAVQVEASPLTVFDLPILPKVIQAYPEGVEGPRVTRVALAIREVDSDRASGIDAFPLGARKHGLGRVAAGSLDWWGGDATDFWTIDVEQGGPILCFFYRERVDQQVTVEAFLPGVSEPVLSLAASSKRRLRVASGVVPAGRLLIRVRQVGGSPGARAYSLFLFSPHEKAANLVRTLFRMIGRQPASSRAFLGSKEFAREVQTALATDAGLDKAALADGVLAALGDRIDEARHLALHLLQAHFPPPLIALERVRRSALATDRERGARVESRRARDAALLIAQLCLDQRRYVEVLRLAAASPADVGDSAPPLHDASRAKVLKDQARAILHKAVLDAARDVNDPRIRLRALAVASRWKEPGLERQLRRELRQILRHDPSTLVKRAIERSFPPELEERARAASSRP